MAAHNLAAVVAQKEIIYYCYVGRSNIAIIIHIGTTLDKRTLTDVLGVAPRSRSLILIGRLYRHIQTDFTDSSWLKEVGVYLRGSCIAKPQRIQSRTAFEYLLPKI